MSKTKGPGLTHLAIGNDQSEFLPVSYIPLFRVTVNKASTAIAIPNALLRGSLYSLELRCIIDVCAHRGCELDSTLLFRAREYGMHEQKRSRSNSGLTDQRSKPMSFQYSNLPWESERSIPVYGI